MIQDKYFSAWQTANCLQHRAVETALLFYLEFYLHFGTNKVTPAANPMRSKSTGLAHAGVSFASDAVFMSGPGQFDANFPLW